MKHIKTYENLNEPQIGDYVICGNPGISEDNIIYDFIINNIGKLVNITNDDPPIYYVHYNNIPSKLSNNILPGEPFRKKSITAWSKYKKEIETIIAANKYNI